MAFLHSEYDKQRLIRGVSLLWLQGELRRQQQIYKDTSNMGLNARFSGVQGFFSEMID